MRRLAGAIDGVIGVDPHRDSLGAAVTDPVGGVLAQTSVSADAAGYQQLLAFARAQVPGRRCWAVEVPAATALGWSDSYRSGASGWWRSAGPSDQPAGAVPRATPWTWCGRPATP